MENTGRGALKKSWKNRGKSQVSNTKKGTTAARDVDWNRARSKISEKYRQ